MIPDVGQSMELDCGLTETNSAGTYVTIARYHRLCSLYRDTYPTPLGHIEGYKGTFEMKANSTSKIMLEILI